MNTPEERLESKLRRLVPADTSRGLRLSVAEELYPAAGGSRVSPGLRRSIWLPWTIAGVSACIAASLALRDAFWTGPFSSGSGGLPASVSDVTTSSDLRMIPVDSTGVLLVALDEGIVYLENGQAVRKLRLQFVDTVRLRDTAATTAIEITTPREEVRFVPVDTL
jgi:hypothetical protein